MAGKRAETLYVMMLLVQEYTLQRAFDQLTDDELHWEPHPGAWGIRSRDESSTPTPLGGPDGQWVADFDKKLAAQADKGRAVEPMTTIGWLLSHIASAPGRLADLDVLGGPDASSATGAWDRMWSNKIFYGADAGIAEFRTGWSGLAARLRDTTDEMLEAEYKIGRSVIGGTQVVATVINEVSHHATQICMLRDWYRQPTM